jgi:hypothetical protein
VEQTGFHVCIAASAPTDHSFSIEFFQINRHVRSHVLVTGSFPRGCSCKLYAVPSILHVQELLAHGLEVQSQRIAHCLVLDVASYTKESKPLGPGDLNDFKTWLPMRHWGLLGK